MCFTRSGDRVLKKSPRLGLTKTRLFGLISKAYTRGASLDWLCTYGNVSRSGYYRYVINKDNKYNRDYEYIELIKGISKRFNHRIGVRRISMLLQESGIIMNTKKISRIKKEYNIPTKIRKARPYNIQIKKDLTHRVAPNLLQQHFKINIPDKVYCTDITYLFYQGGVGYLSATKDIATKEIVAYNVSGNMGIDSGLSGISEMLKRKKGIKDLIIHSDQGVHYTHPKYVELLSSNGVRQSMSRKGVCLDNAPIESFFGHLKDELEYKRCRTLEELKEVIDKYIEYYNNERGQWELNKMPPAKYREHLLSTV